MVTETVSEAELAARLPQILDRISAGERFDVEREGTLVAVMISPRHNSSLTVDELKERFSAPPAFEDWGADIMAMRMWDALATVTSVLEWFKDGMDKPSLLGESDTRILEAVGFARRGG